MKPLNIIDVKKVWLTIKQSKRKNNVIFKICAASIAVLILISLTTTLEPQRFGIISGSDDGQTNNQLHVATATKNTLVNTAQTNVDPTDGVVSPGEYQVKEVIKNDPANAKVFIVYYTIDRVDNMLYMAIVGYCKGWISIAFNHTPGQKMKYTDIIIGYHDSTSGSTVIQDNYGDTGSTHKADTALGGTDDILAAGSSENNTYTTLEFKRALDTGDTYDKVIYPGLTDEIMWGYHTSKDDLTSKHDKKGLGTLTFKAVPAAPQNLQATYTGSSVDLTWQAPTDNGADPITQYHLYRSTSSGSGYVEIGTTTQTSYSDTSISPGNTYYYLVAAENSIGVGLNSTEVSVNVASVPSAPRSLTATATSGSVALSWQAPTSDGGSPILLYKIYRSTTSGSGFVNIANTTDGTTTNYNDTNVINGNTYYYMVSAVNAIGEGPNSTEVSATPAGSPDPPRSLTGQPGNGWIFLSWQVPNNDGGASITKYLIYRGTSQGGPYTNIANTTASVLSYNDTAVTNGQEYYYVVKAENSYGLSQPSNEIKVTPGNVPSEPINLAIQHGDGWILISWDPPTDNGGSSIQYYLIYRSTQSGTNYVMIANVSASTTQYNDTGLTNGQAYYYVITATNNDGEGPYSQEISDIPGTKPEPPTSVEIITVGNQTLTLKWSTPTDDGGYSIIEYRIYRATTSGGPYSKIANVSTMQYTDSGLTNGQVYYYVITAVNQEGESAYSAEINGTPMTVPEAPKLTEIIAGDGFVYLNWTAPNDDGGASITQYLIYRKVISTSTAVSNPRPRPEGHFTITLIHSTQTSNFENIANTTQTFYNDTTVENGQTYEYYVVAENAAGTSAPSNTLTAQPVSSGNNGSNTTTTPPTSGPTSTPTTPPSSTSGSGPADSTPSASNDTNDGNVTDQASPALNYIVVPELFTTITLASIFLVALLSPFAIGILKKKLE